MVIKKLKIEKKSKELFHDNPRLKPPRYDLRKRKVLDDPDLTNDPDLESEPSDKDMEKN